MIINFDVLQRYFQKVSRSGKCLFILSLPYLICIMQMANGDDSVNILNNSILNTDDNNGSLFKNNMENYTNFEDTTMNVTNMLEPPNWQIWLDNSQIAISVIGKYYCVIRGVIRSRTH